MPALAGTNSRETKTRKRRRECNKKKGRAQLNHQSIAAAASQSPLGPGGRLLHKHRRLELLPQLAQGVGLRRLLALRGGGVDANVGICGGVGGRGFLRGGGGQRLGQDLGGGLLSHGAVVLVACRSLVLSAALPVLDLCM